MSFPRRALYLVGAAAYLAASPAPLRVLRVSPTGDAERSATIAVTFDRPVAGSLDRTVDAKSILRIEPAVAGKAEWRDPVTLTFTASALLRPNTRYTVRVANSFRAMDGSRLAEPYRFSFRAKGPTLVTGSPANANAHPRFLTPKATFELVYSSAVDLAKLSEAAYLEFRAGCRGERVTRLTAVSQRRIAKGDPWHYRSGVVAVDSLRRVVHLVPVTPLPRACAGELVAPVELAEGRSELVRWRFATYGPLRLGAVRCAEEPYCPTGPLVVEFSTPVSGAEVMRHVRLVPETPFTVRDTAFTDSRWVLEGKLTPRVVYAVVADTAMRDVFGQRPEGNPASAFRTTGYEPSISYPYGRLTVERNGFGTLAVQHVNVDTLVVITAPVPDSLEGQFIRRSQWSMGELWQRVRAGASVTRIAVRAGEDRPTVTGIKLPSFAAANGRRPTLLAVRVTSTHPDTARDRAPAIAVVQVTDLGVHAKIGAESGVVWVTGASDGRAKAGASVTLYDFKGRIVATATTSSQGIATLSGFRGEPSAGRRANESEGEEDTDESFEGYVGVTLAGDRALAGVSQYDPDLSPWRFNIAPAYGAERVPAAGAVFTERGIYRPGEQLFAKAIVRSGPLGALSAPERGDSLRWVFKDRDQGALKDTVVSLSPFGTADYALQLPSAAPLGTYSVEIQGKRQGRWLDLGSATYRVAEYRPPEFLVELSADSTPRFPGDSLRPTVQARYLFGAPMARAVVSWQAWQTPVSSWELELPGAEGYFVGESGWSEDDSYGARSQSSVFATGTDTLDAKGQRTLRVKLPRPHKGRAARVTISASVRDVNRQTVGDRTTVTVHPASFYVAAKPLGRDYFWTAGAPQSIGVLAVRPTGEKVAGVRVRGAIARREWHQVHRERNGVAETLGEWVTDTVGRCDVTTTAEPAECAFTPTAGGTYVITLRAKDERGRAATTTFYRWATGKEWVPWDDEGRLKMDVIADKTRYSVGDTATLLFASPFTNAEAWITVEREGLIDQRRMTLTSGSTTLKFPITEAYAPNAFVSILIARGRSAPPGRLDDPGRPTIRVGYAELRVTPEAKRLAVDVEPLAQEYRPGDSARVRVQVRDRTGVGQKAEVTLWAVDEGVLALTGYQTPDPLDLLYRPRGLGLRLASNLASVAPQIPVGEKGSRAPGGGGGADLAEILRSRFKTTGFFLGSVVTDAEGKALAAAKLPDNLTTFRVMAVAVTAGDRFGSGHSSLLVTKPLLARAALPRFARPGDAFTAGSVVNERAGGTPTVKVEARVTGAELRGDRTRSALLESGRGKEVRFAFRVPPSARVRDDSAAFRFDVSSGRNADAVQAKIPIRPDFHPRAFTVSGVLRDSATAELMLPAEIDPERSRVTFSLGTSPLVLLSAVRDELRVYPYYCSEQVTSVAVPLIALYRAQQETAATAPARDDARKQLESAVAILSARQRTDGGIGFWGADDWTSPWLSAYAGSFLLAARGAGIAVSDSVLARLAGYLTRDLHNATTARLMIPVANWYDDRTVRLSDRVAAVDFLSRMGRPDLAVENQLFSLAAQLRWEDRVLLAEVLGRRGATREAITLLRPAWQEVKVEGNRAVLPANAYQNFYFDSHARPVARLLTATLTVSPTHQLIGPLVEALVQQGRASRWAWNTQDAGSVSAALIEFERRQQRAADRGIRVRAGNRVLFQTGARGVPRDSSAALAGLLADAPNGDKLLRLSLDASDAGAVAYYYITVHEVPLERPVTPIDRGVQVERWYERYDSKTPIVSAAEGDLVRVRLRVTVPEERHFLVLDDALPAGLEAVDLSLRTTAALPGPGAAAEQAEEEGGEVEGREGWWFGSWDSGWWTPWDHRELRDDRVVYVATTLWPGTYTASYVARATTPGVFVRPPAHAEEMYNPAVNGRSEGGVFTVTER